jgi:hypothetical protein
MQIVFFAYVLFIWIKYGRQKSISESYYALPDKLRPLFTLFCWGFAFPAIIIGSSGLMFGAGAGICFVGAACAIRQPMTRKVHLTAAISGIVFAFLAIIFQYHMWYLAAAYVALAPLIYIWDKKHFVWWIEIFAFLAISIALGVAVF